MTRIMLIRLSEAEWQDRLDQAAKSGIQLSPWHRRRRFDQEHTQTEPSHSSDCKSQEVGGSLGAQDSGSYDGVGSWEFSG
eukprot:s2168_g6.t2